MAGASASTERRVGSPAQRIPNRALNRPARWCAHRMVPKLEVRLAIRCGPEPALTRGRTAWRRGLQAEAAACAALERDGWTILLRRARTPCGEIDIVAERPGTLLAFVEVKARPALRAAAAALSQRQQERLLRAAEILLASHPDWTHDGIRFDLLLVDPTGTVRRIADAFRRQQPG